MRTIFLNQNTKEKMKSKLFARVLNKSTKDIAPGFNADIFLGITGGFEQLRENLDCLNLPTEGQIILKTIANTINDSVENYVVKKNGKLYAMEADEDLTEDEEVDFAVDESEKELGNDDVDTESFDSPTSSTNALSDLVASLFTNLAEKNPDEIKNLAKTILKMEKDNQDKKIDETKEEDGDFVSEDDDKEAEEGNDEGEGSEGFGDDTSDAGGFDGGDDFSFDGDGDGDDSGSDNPFDTPDNGGDGDESDPFGGEEGDSSEGGNDEGEGGFDGNSEEEEGGNPFDGGSGEGDGGDSGDVSEGDTENVNPFDNDSGFEQQKEKRTYSSYNKLPIRLYGAENLTEAVYPLGDLNPGDVLAFASFIVKPTFKDQLESSYAKEDKTEFKEVQAKYATTTKNITESLAATLAFTAKMGIAINSNFIKHPDLY
ncbi:MAG: hypothetical protein ACRC92_20560 [Peptostreptococcaceae bacterium]